MHLSLSLLLFFLSDVMCFLNTNYFNKCNLFSNWVLCHYKRFSLWISNNVNFVILTQWNQPDSKAVHLVLKLQTLPLHLLILYYIAAICIPYTMSYFLQRVSYIDSVTKWCKNGLYIYSACPRLRKCVQFL